MRTYMKYFKQGAFFLCPYCNCILPLFGMAGNESKCRSCAKRIIAKFSIKKAIFLLPVTIVACCFSDDFIIKIILNNQIANIVSSLFCGFVASLALVLCFNIELT